MNKLFLIPLAFILSCGTVKTPQNAAQGNEQLLKDVETLASDAYEGRKTGTKGAEMARTYLTGRLKEIGLEPYPGKASYEQSFEVKGRNGAAAIEGKNLIAYIPGKTENVIVISAHYDHVGIIKNEIYNGADDNATVYRFAITIRNTAHGSMWQANHAKTHQDPERGHKRQIKDLLTTLR